MSNGATVDITNMSFMWGGIPVTGMGPGTPLSLSYASAQNQVFAGVDGLSVFVKSKARNATIRCELMPNSPWNAVFSSALKADFVTKGGLVIPLVMLDMGGSSEFSTEASKVSKLPDFAVGDGLNVRVWELVIGKMRGFIGGMKNPIEGTPELPTL